jgi:hypothetical protein
LAFVRLIGFHQKSLKFSLMPSIVNCDRNLKNTGKLRFWRGFESKISSCKNSMWRCWDLEAPVTMLLGTPLILRDWSPSFWTHDDVLKHTSWLGLSLLAPCKYLGDVLQLFILVTSYSM